MTDTRTASDVRKERIALSSEASDLYTKRKFAQTWAWKADHALTLDPTDAKAKARLDKHEANREAIDVRLNEIASLVTDLDAEENTLAEVEREAHRASAAAKVAELEALCDEFRATYPDLTFSPRYYQIEVSRHGVDERTDPQYSGYTVDVSLPERRWNDELRGARINWGAYGTVSIADAEVYATVLAAAVNVARTLDERGIEAA